MACGAWSRIPNAIVAALLAPTCAVCETLLDDPLGGCVCAQCWRAVRPMTPPICDRCGDPLARNVERCGSCGREERWVDRARAIGEYEGTLREIVQAFKYAGRRSLARPLAEAMRHRGADVLADADCAVPVPLHWRREYRRGFNQARELARHLGIPVADALVRCARTRAQVELAAGQRRANVEGAFRRRRGWGTCAGIEGLKVVLIDDVSTTGATLESCARVLKQCGAREVFALTAARVVTRRRVSKPESPIPSRE